MINNLSKIVINNGGELRPLIISAEHTKGFGLCNPSILSHNNELLVNIRNTHYTLHHNEGVQKFQNSWSGPLQYLNPEDDQTLTTVNFLCKLDSKSLSISSTHKIDTSKLDVPPLWEFVGLEDGRLVNWDNQLFLCGVRRDTTTNGEGRMEISTIVNNKETKRNRIDIPKTSPYLYCEKNWMPILDMPYHFIKWANPLEIVKVNPKTNTSEVVITKPESKLAHTNLRGGSQVIQYGEYRIAIIHEVFFPRNPQNNKDAKYFHRFLVWDKDWNLISVSQEFNFMSAFIEFSCGMTVHEDNILVTFGFQDNAAYILKIPNEFFKKLINIDTKFSEFDWGQIKQDPWFEDKLKEEIILDNAYEKFFKVEKGDVVLDVGASVGPFTYSILDREPKQVICVEPQPILFKTLEKNVGTNKSVICLNKGLTNVDTTTLFTGLYHPNNYYIGEEVEQADGITFKTLVSQNSLKKIDFMKLDCEGGEYDVFNAENKNWVVSNVRKIVGEFHLHNDEYKEKFKQFRDIYLTTFKNYQIYAMNGVDIKWDLFNPHFIEYYGAVMVYIDNREIKQPSKEYWRTTKYPTMEFTTSIPPKGCVVDCAFCPQRTLVNVYKGDKMMTFENFKKVVDKLPKEIRVTFSGFTEPWLNPQATDMLLYAHEQGHPVSAFSTGIGMTIDDVRRIKNIPFADGPNGGFCLHLPDEEYIAKHPISKRYIEVLEYFKEVQHEIQGFYLMAMGEVKKDLQYIFPTAATPDMWSRAGNLLGEAIIKPELDKIKDRFKHMDHGNNKMTCGCDEKLYHNVVLPNGDVSLCCMDYGLKQILGNIYTQEYNDIIPKPLTCFALCQKCENGVSPNKK